MSGDYNPTFLIFVKNCPKTFLIFVKKIKIRVNILINPSDILIETVTYMDVIPTRT